MSAPLTRLPGTAREATAPFRISPLQESMLRGSKDGTSGHEIEQLEITFHQTLCGSLLENAWRDTVANTEILRMAFVFQEGIPVGIRPIPLPGMPLLESCDQPGDFVAWLAADRCQPLPLDGGLPWRVRWFPSIRKLVWTFHHALLDGRSITRIVKHLLARLDGSPPPPPLAFRPWTPPGATEVSEAESYHRRMFAKVDPFQLEFPEDTPPPAQPLRIDLGRHILEKLETAARHYSVTVPTLLTWSWAQTLAKVSGMSAVAIGQVRSGPRDESAAGFAMTTVPLVVSRPATESTQTALADLRKRLHEMRAIERVAPTDLPLDVFHHAGGPWPAGVLMVEHGTLQHQIGTHPLVQEILLHESAANDSLLACAWIHPNLTIEAGGSSDRFGMGALRALIDTWAATTTAIAERSSIDAAAIVQLSAAMSHLSESREIGGDPIITNTLWNIWSDRFTIHSQRVAIQSKESITSFKQLNDFAEHLAEQLRRHGVKAGDPVASRLKDRKNLAGVILALTRLGAIHVPLDPVLPEPRLKAIVEDAKPSWVLSDSPDQCTGLGLPCLAISEEIGMTCRAPVPNNPKAPLAILYTSGSTGRPKGVVMPHRGVANEVLAIAELAGIRPGDRMLQFASPGFDASLEEVFACLLSGATLVPRSDESASDLEEFHKFIADEQLTVLDLPTSHWSTWCNWMAEEGRTIPEKVRSVIIGGERASRAAVLDWLKTGGGSRILVNSYGPTEASIVATAEIIDGTWNEPGDPAIGRPLPGVRARVADARGMPLPPGAAGELWLSGICLGDGYWRNPERTAQEFQWLDGEAWYRTGDRVFRDPAGRLRFLGRKDDQIKVRGTRVEPNEVIRVLETYPGVANAHAGLVTTAKGAEVLAGWVRWRTPPDPNWPARIAAHAAAQLAAAAVPVRWAAVDEFILNERGKLDRSTLPAPTLTSSSRCESEKPATPTEATLARMFAELLGIDEVGRDESFFELGGHSLAALQLFARITREWKIRIPMAALISSPTPRSLGSLLDHKIALPAGDPAGEPAVFAVRHGDHRPPLFCIHGGDGGVIFYRNLAKHLPAGRSMLAIESPALSADAAVEVTSVEDAAAAYIRSLRRHQESGPYHLAGYSFGGLLAYEIARQLTDAGEIVAFTGLFDTVNPAAPAREYSLLERAEVFWNSERDTHWLFRLGRLATRIRDGITTHFRVREEIRAARSAGATEPHSEIRALQVREAHWEAMTCYHPQPLHCHISLFKTRSADDKYELPHDYGWSRLAQTLEIIEVPGKHLTMFSHPHVSELARQVARRLI